MSQPTLTPACLHFPNTVDTSKVSSETYTHIFVVSALFKFIAIRNTKALNSITKRFHSLRHVLP